MPQSPTICVSLPAEYAQALDRLARETGSRSAAVRRLLDAHRKGEWLKKAEAAYEEYFADPAAVAADRELTQEMLSASSWLPSRPPPGKKVRRVRSQRAQG
jgi:metal-responsive CopG/Arc/MetJ family transcriptional regulator